MLVDLAIRNFAIVEDVELSFDSGFTVITGETGAGKSILVDALTLLSGGRAASEMLRHEAEKMTVTARFQAESAISASLAESGVTGDGEIVIRREIEAGGRSRAFMNGEPVAAKTVSRAGELLLVIHGQGGERQLLDPEAALDLLDAYAGADELACAVEGASRAFLAADARRKRLVESRRDRDRRLELLEFEIREIREAGLEGMSEESLMSERNVLLHAGKIRQLGETACAALEQDEGSALDRTGEAFKALSELSRIDSSFQASCGEAAEVKSRLSELARRVERETSGVEADPERLTEVETRLDKLSRLKKKYGASISEILEHGERAAAERDSLGNLEDSLAALEKECARLASEYAVHARELSGKRRQAAPLLSAGIQKELAELAMEKSKFRVELLPRDEEISPRGCERSEFLFAPNPGEPEKPLSKIASGGELSRVQLAVESARLKRRGPGSPRTLIFDEVDAGIGGRVAEAVGRKLKVLSAKNQVLCVTHLPQIAALADRQLCAVKKVSRGRTRAEVTELSPEQRIEEIARMLAGETVSATARDHARTLLNAR